MIELTSPELSTGDTARGATSRYALESPVERASSLQKAPAQTLLLTRP